MTFIRKKRILTSTLMLVWLLISFGPSFFARDLSVVVWGWPFYFWMAAQGSILMFFCIIVVYAFLINRWEAQEVAAGRFTSTDGSPATDKR
jgi:putative solute:sodium symporter small subunit